MTSENNINKDIQYWNLPGNLENWNIGIERKVWGMKSKFFQTWNRISVGDILFFYVSAPIKGIIGYGHVTTKFIGESPLWPDEIEKSEVIYPYLFEFEIDKLLESVQWRKRCVSVHDLNIVIQSIGRIPQEKAKKIFQRFGAEFQAVPKIKEEKSPYEKLSKHDQAKKLLLEIGRMQGYISEEEYRLDGERLDTVWKKVEKSVPKYAFEVQIGGDIYHALGKLKHASDIWNSQIYLVIDQESIPKVTELLSGTFHEIAGMLKVLQLERIAELGKSLSHVHKLIEEFGL